MRYRISEVRAEAKRLGLEVETQALGDGVRRYKFGKPDGHGWKWSSDTCRGVSAAILWLDGFRRGAGRRT